MLYLLDVTREAADPAPDHDGCGGAGCWWGDLVNTEEEGLQALTQSLQTMWNMGVCSELELDIEEERTVAARSRTSPGLSSQMDVPTRDEEAARESAATVLGAIRQLAALLWPAEHPASVAASGSGSRRGQAAGYGDWEVLQAEVMMPPPPSSERPQLPAASASSSSCCWGEGLWCFNPACANLSGPSELAMQTSACGGGCGVRYCSPECQAQGWRDGHRLSCARLRARREGIASTQMCEGACLGEAEG